MKNPQLYIQGIRDKVEEYFYLKRTRIEAMQVAVERLTSAHDRNQQQLKRFQTPVRFFVNSSQSLPQTVSMCTKPSIGGELSSSAGNAHSHPPPPPPVSILFDHGWHAWPSLNKKQLLCIPNGPLHLLGAGDAPWLCPVQDREGEDSTAHEDSVHKGRKATTLFGSLWMDEDSRGTCCKLKLLQNHTRDRRSFALKAYEYLLEEENQEDWERVQDGIEDMDPFDDPFACVAVFGDWNFSFCDLRGGYDHVMSLRESGSVNVSHCYFNNLPQVMADSWSFMLPLSSVLPFVSQLSTFLLLLSPSPPVLSEPPSPPSPFLSAIIFSFCPFLHSRSPPLPFPSPLLV